MEGVPVRVHIQHVHGELVRGQVHRRENLIQCHLIGAIHANLSENMLKVALFVKYWITRTNWLKVAHFLFAVRLEGFLDESEQVLLVHGGGSVDVGVHLKDNQGVRLGAIINVPLFTNRCFSLGLVEFDEIEQLPFARCRNPDG